LRTPLMSILSQYHDSRVRPASCGRSSLIHTSIIRATAVGLVLVAANLVFLCVGARAETTYKVTASWDGTEGTGKDKKTKLMGHVGMTKDGVTGSAANVWVSVGNPSNGGLFFAKTDGKGDISRLLPMSIDPPPPITRSVVVPCLAGMDDPHGTLSYNAAS